MKSVSKDIWDHLYAHMGIFVNAQGVETDLRPNDTVCIAAPWPGATDDDSDYFIEIYIEADSLDNLVTITGIYTLQQFLDFPANRLLELYHQGRAIVACAIDREGLYYGLNFIKRETSVWAVDDYDEASLVPVPPETPEEFFRYLRSHARINRIIF